MSERGNGKKGNALLDSVENVKRYDLSQQENWERDYPAGNFNNTIKDIYDLPGIDDMPAVLLRGRIKNERQLNAILRLMYRHGKFNDTRHKELLRAKIAGSAAIGGVRSLEALFGAIQIVASDMYRAVLGLPKLKRGEEEKIVKGGDFRKKDEFRPEEGGLGVNK